MSATMYERGTVDGNGAQSPISCEPPSDAAVGKRRTYDGKSGRVRESNYGWRVVENICGAGVPVYENVNGMRAESGVGNGLVS